MTAPRWAVAMWMGIGSRGSQPRQIPSRPDADTTTATATTTTTTTATTAQTAAAAASSSSSTLVAEQTVGTVQLSEHSGTVSIVLRCSVVVFYRHFYHIQ